VRTALNFLLSSALLRSCQHSAYPVSRQRLWWRKPNNMNTCLSWHFSGEFSSSCRYWWQQHTTRCSAVLLNGTPAVHGSNHSALNTSVASTSTSPHQRQCRTAGCNCWVMNVLSLKAAATNLSYLLLIAACLCCCCLHVAAPPPRP